MRQHQVKMLLDVEKNMPNTATMPHVDDNFFMTCNS